MRLAGQQHVQALARHARVRGEPCPPDGGHDDAALEQVVLCDARHQVIERPRLAGKGVQASDDRVVQKADRIHIDGSRFAKRLAHIVGANAWPLVGEIRVA